MTITPITKTSFDTPTKAGQSFEEFFVQAWPGALRLASALTQDTAAGEEIAQDVLVSIYRTWGVTEQPEAYLRRSVKNACNSLHRKARTHRAKLPLLAVPDHVDFSAHELSDVIAALPVRQRAVITLRYQFDMTEREIAETLGCRPGTVKSLASRALDRLETELCDASLPIRPRLIGR